MHFIKRDPYAILALLNHPAANYSQIQRITKNLKWPSPQTFYKQSSHIVLKINHHLLSKS